MRISKGDELLLRSVSCFSHTIDAILTRFENVERDLGVLETWSGKHRIVDTASGWGLCAEGIDKNMGGGSNDFNTEEGFLNFAKSCMRLSWIALARQTFI